MPRRARIALPNVPVHLIQRGNNRQPCFFADEDYRRYLDGVAEYAAKPGSHPCVCFDDESCAFSALCQPGRCGQGIDEVAGVSALYRIESSAGEHDGRAEVSASYLRGRALENSCPRITGKWASRD